MLIENPHNCLLNNVKLKTENQSGGLSRIDYSISPYGPLAQLG